MKKLLFETKHWNVFIISEQSYLGRGRVELKDIKESLSELTEDEWVDFG